MPLRRPAALLDAFFFAQEGGREDSARMDRQVFEWDNGMVPQIAFNERFLGNYFPEPNFWRVPQGRPTSGITMPPLHSIACLHIFQHAKGFGKRKDIFHFILQYLDSDEKARYLADHMDTVEVEYLFYDWNLNH